MIFETRSRLTSRFWGWGTTLPLWHRRHLELGILYAPPERREVRLGHVAQDALRGPRHPWPNNSKERVCHTYENRSPLGHPSDLEKHSPGMVESLRQVWSWSVQWAPLWALPAQSLTRTLSRWTATIILSVVLIGQAIRPMILNVLGGKVSQFSHWFIVTCPEIRRLSMKQEQLNEPMETQPVLLFEKQTEKVKFPPWNEQQL